MRFRCEDAVDDYVSKCLQLALLLEVSAYPKPGNVHRIADFSDTRYEHFLASSVALLPHFRLAAKRGVQVSKGEFSLDEVEIGKVIKDSVEDMVRWQRGGNTLLGAVILLSPIAVASGITFSQRRTSLKKLRENVHKVVVSTTPKDAVNVYDAIKKANPSGLGNVSELDINDPDSKRRILKERISLYQIFKIASPYDAICSEWVNNYPITFDVAHPLLMEQLEKAHDLNTAIVHTYLKVLAEHPDTFIARKTDIQKAHEASSMAKEVLELGGLETLEGKERLHEFDLELRKSGNLLNPGTTADIIAAALALSVLGGYRP